MELWKILLLDNTTKRIVAPLLDTAQLKRLGITLTYTTTQARNPVYGVPAIYFVQPEKESITTICNVSFFTFFGLSKYFS